MLPNSSSTPSSSSSIYINPKFRNVHINPNFLSKSNGINQTVAEPTFATAPTQIYINPRFLGNGTGIAMTKATDSAPIMVHAKENFVQTSAHMYHESLPLVAEPLADTKIHTRTKIFNNPVKVLNVPVAPKINTVVVRIDSTKSLIKIGSKKLVRASAKTFTKPSQAIPIVRRPLQTKYKIIKEQTAFKIDRRSAKAKLAAITRNIVPLVSSRKFCINESLMPIKTITR